jgi:serine/threonine protein kinase/Tol biopolymer transport system component
VSGFTRHVESHKSHKPIEIQAIQGLCTILSQFASFVASRHNGTQITCVFLLRLSMSLGIGTQLGSLEITALLGRGGMGEVYRARDTKLKRDVAIKVLPEEFSRDADRISRFQREAEVLASLNHPNIAGIYDVREAGASRFLILELVEGETLADRLTRGPLSIEETLSVAKSICEALEAAHEKGVIHRDLKPANVKITPEGGVKVLDFGLAKAIESTPTHPALSNSPTLMSVGATNAGVILGTAAYMSPEQAKGRAVDKRTDIFAFGAVLYEMLTGRQAFEGEDVTQILARLLEREPDLSRLPLGVPPRIRELLRLCLQKDIRKRRSDAADVRIDIELALSEPPDAMPLPAASRTHERVWMAVAGVLVIAIAGLAFVHFREIPPLQHPLRFQIAPTGTAVPEFLTISPDGRRLALVASGAGPRQLWIRAMDTLESKPLAGTEDATYPFWSPDGTNIGFFAQGKLKKIAIAGGPAQTLCDATSGRGGSWNRDGVILFSQGPISPILGVSAAGGVPTPVITVAGADSAVAGHRFPAFLPDGIHFLYNAGSAKPDAAGIYLGSLAGTVPVRILPDVSNALYAPPAVPGGVAHLLFRRGGDILMAQPFDPRTLRATGEMFPVAEHVTISANAGFGAFSVSETGILVYRTFDEAASRQLVWIDRSGKRAGIVGKPNRIRQLAISPDERTVALEIVTPTGENLDIWLQDLRRDALTRFTFRSGVSGSPVWSPDAANLIFFSRPGAGAGSTDILQRLTAGNAGEEVLLGAAGINGLPDDLSSDGRWVVYQKDGGKTGTDLWLLPLAGRALGDNKPIPYLQTPFVESDARFSPDGKWMVYASNESGQNQVYVQAVPAGAGKWQISTAGGSAPHWRSDGKEIFYIALDQKLMAVPIKLGPVVEPGTPQVLFPFPPVPTGLSSFDYGPSKDGQRFLVNAPADATAPPITVVINWQADLKK